MSKDIYKSKLIEFLDRLNQEPYKFIIPDLPTFTLKFSLKNRDKNIRCRKINTSQTI
jgi:hypothetical protein